jgi:hypothetical protein
MATDTQQPGTTETSPKSTDITTKKPRRVRFDGSRPVPWKYLVTWSSLVIVLMLGTTAISDRSKMTWGIVFGAFAAGLLYLGLGWLLTKFGWDPTKLALQRRQLREARMAAKKAAKDGTATTTVGSSTKPNSRKPANAVAHKVPPTKRTNLTNQRKVKAR